MSRLEILFLNFPKSHFFGNNWEIKNFIFFNFVYIDPLVTSKYTSCPKFVSKYWFLRKLCRFPFLPIYKDIDQDLRKSQCCNFWSKAAKAFKFCHLMPYMMHLKVINYWGSEKIFSMCKIENAGCGEKFHHPPGCRVKNLLIFEKKLENL